MGRWMGTGPRRNAHWPTMVVQATPDQTEAVKKRVVDAATAALAKIPEGMRQFAGKDVQRVLDVIEKLPALDGLYGLAVELRTPILDAYVDMGVDVPQEMWAKLGVAAVYRVPVKVNGGA